MLLSKKLKENNINEEVGNDDVNMVNDDGGGDDNMVKDNDNSKRRNETSLLSTLKIQKFRKIPYQIPADLLNMPTNLKAAPGLLCFEPTESECILCGTKLSNSMYPQGMNSEGGNGTLISNAQSFLKVHIKIRKCVNTECKAIHVPYLFHQGNAFSFLYFLFLE